ncbi:MAG: right-handed parallel beta-helix repeat-containing protein [Sphingobacteriales bacterium]|nr:right-handed parallel beta-helix repeat-containing protein [Sphingobacteriales bacterium]
MSFRKNKLILVPALRAPDALEPISAKSIFGERISLRASSVVFLFFNLQNFNIMKKVITLLFALLCGATATLAQTTRYVAPTATGSGDGSSWANASGDLHAMINASAAGDAVWVKAGTYKPTAYPTGCVSCSTPRDYTFYVKDGVKLYGGFAGTETALSQRLITTNVTTLSGDIGTAGDATDNAYHVVLASTGSGGVGVTVDGFTITGGNANGSNYITVNGYTIYRNVGGGIYTYNGTNTITNNTLSGNSADGGGGIYTEGGTNTLTNNTLSGNSSGYGGGIYTYYATNTIANNTLSGNSASGYGGGIYTSFATNTIANNTLSGNSAGNGGGIYTNYSTNTITNNSLSGNTAGNGGGIYAHEHTNTFTNNTLLGNSAGNGGGIYLDADMSGIANFTNNIFWGNQKGGSSIVAGADYYNNLAMVTVTFTNNLLQLASGTYTDANYNNLGTQSGNIFETDPLFVNAADIDGADNLHRTADDGLFLQSTSPAINAGTATGAPATDILGTARPQGTGIDMGAYEWFNSCPSVVTLYVDASIAASGNGETWATAYKTLDEALAVAHCCSIIDTIKVAAGTYLPTKKPYNGCTEMTTADARDITFHLPDGLVLWGGYPAGGGVRNSAANVTTLSGDFNGDDVVTGSGATLSITGNGENAYHVVLASAPTSGGIGVTIDGFSIIGGHANGSGPVSVNGNNIYRYHGGGILAYRGTNTLTNNILSGNSANSYANDAGGGICAFYGTNTITNNILSKNRASYFGGGICAFYGTNTITDNNLSGNWANTNGGGIGTFIGSNNTLANNTLSGNSAGYGGGIYTNNSTNTLTNNTLLGNSAGWGGGIYTDISSTNTITNNTLSGNSSGNGGGIYIGNSTNTLTNNTLSGNSSGNGGGIYIDNGTNTLTNNTLSGNWATNGGGGGGGVYTNNGTNAFINNIFWGK